MLGKAEIQRSRGRVGLVQKSDVAINPRRVYQQPGTKDQIVPDLIEVEKLLM